MSDMRSSEITKPARRSMVVDPDDENRFASTHVEYAGWVPVNWPLSMESLLMLGADDASDLLDV